MSFAANNKTSFRLPVLVLVVLLDLVVSTLAYPPACNAYYGRPNYDHCSALISGPTYGPGGIIARDRAHHFFGISGIERPPEISTLQVCIYVRCFFLDFVTFPSPPINI